jgi:nickel superoxide dismutase
MKKVLLALALVLVLFAANRTAVHSHCEIPCGIYTDWARITLLYEDVTTVEKSMQEIIRLADPSKALAPVDVNQAIRWVTNKEEHCNKIQHSVAQYFLTQRIKPQPEGSGEAYTKYLAQLTTAHKLLVDAMKAKQQPDLAHVKSLREGVKKLSELVLTEADLKHVSEHHPEGK